MPSNKLIPNVEYQAHQVGHQQLNSRRNVSYKCRRQLEKDKFKRRYNVSYVLDAQGNDLVDWGNCTIQVLLTK